MGLALASTFLFGCSGQVEQSNNSTSSSLLEKSQQQRLQAIYKIEKATGISQDNSFVAIAENGSFEDVVFQIISNGGVIQHSDSVIGYVAFKASANAVQNLDRAKSLIALSFDEKVENHIPKYDPSSMSASGESQLTKNLYPTELMNVIPMQKGFKEKGITLDGSSTTIAIFDTGLDMGRTDIFQDRIVELRTLRDTDYAKVVEATSEVIDGVEFLTASIDGKAIKIKRTDRLSEDRKYFVGYFSEEQFKNQKYDKYDFNQDGKISAIFPVVASKNSDGNFEVYVNVNSSLTYGEMGDDSIEDENMMLDFNYVSKNIEDRFHKNIKKPIKSYYKYTTRLDVSSKNSSNQTVITNDRNKGIVNLAITAEKGFELDAAGDLLNKAYKNQTPYYRIGLVGFDLGDHGTHCAGTATGNFLSAPQFSSAAKNAKIIGGTILGTGYRYSEYFNMLNTVIKNHKNLVFSFSFGSNTSINPLGGTTAKFYDSAAKKHGVAFVKAAGNEGPAINTHGAGTALWTIDVANYYSSNSRNSHSGRGDDLGQDQLLVSPSSSRGPLFDGALKPDIGGPGYVMSSISLSKAIDGKKRAFEYMAGTSMATPNVASVVALLFDAAVKTGLTDESSDVNPVSIDKIHKAIKNSALPYGTLKTSGCRATMGLTGKCKLVDKEHKFAWIEGGAGRINAEGAWKILGDIIEEDISFVSTRTGSYLSGFEGYGVGYYSYNSVPDSTDFSPVLSDPVSTEDYLQMKSYSMKIEADWIFFDRNRTIKEKIIEVIPGERPQVNLYFDRKKLMENGRLKAGVHSTVIKAYDLESPEYFDWVFPVTVVGADTHFDPMIDDGSFSASGFVPVGQFAGHFIPVDTDGSSLLLDLHTDAGALLMKVYYQGMELDYKSLGIERAWANSNTNYIASTNNSRYVLPNLKAGMYEIIILSDTRISHEYKDNFGSFYDLNINKLSLNVGDLTIARNTNTSLVTMSNVSAPKLTAIGKAQVYSDRIKMEKKIEVKDKEKLELEVEVVEGAEILSISTEYFGITEKMDIDLALLDPNGKQVGASGNQDSSESIVITTGNGLKPGTYKLVVEGYNVPSKGELFDLKIQQVMSKEIILAETLTDKFLGKTIGGKSSYLRATKEYDFIASIDMGLLKEYEAVEGYEAVISARVSIRYGSQGQSSVVYREQAR